MSYTIQGAISRLQQADAIRALEFYVCHTDGKTHAFSARCWESLNQLKDVDKFVEELNAAVKPVCGRWSQSILDDVHNDFPKVKDSHK